MRVLGELRQRWRTALIEHRFRRIVGRHRRARWAAVAADLARARPGHVLLAGDSHAELLGAADPGARDLGAPLVNAGVGGIRAAQYAADLARLPEGPRAALAVLIVGANDTVCARAPLSPRRARAFEAAATRLVARLRARADAVLVCAILPVRPQAAGKGPGLVDARAALLYSARLERVAAAHGCAYLDPFAALRDRDPAWLRPDVGTDPGGCHLADYGLVRRALAPAVAAALAAR